MAVKRNQVEREYCHSMRGESAARCIGKISKGIDIFGLTKGDFSMIDIIRHLVNEMGPCQVDIGTWTAARSDIAQAYNLIEDERITRLRFLVDRSFPSRQPKYYRSLIEKFGRDSVRIARFHAKFIVMRNDEWDIAVRTSMNLNENKRIEFYEISEGSPISGYLTEIMEAHFSVMSEDSYSAFKDLNLSKPKETGETDKTQENPTRFGGWD